MSDIFSIENNLNKESPCYPEFYSDYGLIVLNDMLYELEICSVHDYLSRGEKVPSGFIKKLVKRTRCMKSIEFADCKLVLKTTGKTINVYVQKPGEKIYVPNIQSKISGCKMLVIPVSNKPRRYKVGPIPLSTNSCVLLSSKKQLEIFKDLNVTNQNQYFITVLLKYEKINL